MSIRSIKINSLKQNAASRYRTLLGGNPVYSKAWVASLVPEANPTLISSSILYSNNLYVAGFTGTSGPQKAYLAKFNIRGALDWQRQLGVTSGSGSSAFLGVSADSSGNIRASGQLNSSFDQSILAKYSSSGTFVSEDELYAYRTYNAAYSTLETLSTGVSYTSGSLRDSNGDNISHIFVSAWDTDNSSLWNKTYQSTQNYDGYAEGIAVSSSGNIFVLGVVVFPGGYFSHVLKLNSSGVVQWQRYLSANLGNPRKYSQIAVDSSENVYLAGYLDSAAFITKIDPSNSSAPIQWSKQLTSNLILKGIDLDSSGDLYVSGMIPGSGNDNKGFIAKYDTAYGDLQWQRKLSNNDSSRAVWFESVTCLAGTNDLVVTGYEYIPNQPTISSAQVGLVAKFPNDGSQTGTYTNNWGTYTYSAASATAGGVITQSLPSYLSTITKTLYHSNTLSSSTANATVTVS